jgi:hypothetical protein
LLTRTWEGAHRPPGSPFGRPEYSPHFDRSSPCRKLSKKTGFQVGRASESDREKTPIARAMARAMAAAQ